jgi:hypothetical protein
LKEKKKIYFKDTGKGDWLDSSGSGSVSVAYCEHNNELSGSVKYDEYVNKLSNY